MKHISISIGEQRLYLLENDKVLSEFTISSAANGIGFDQGSYCTPTGRLVIQEKIGDGEPSGTMTIFIRRLINWPVDGAPDKNRHRGSLVVGKGHALVDGLPLFPAIPHSPMLSLSRLYLGYFSLQPTHRPQKFCAVPDLSRPEYHP